MTTVKTLYHTIKTTPQSNSFIHTTSTLPKSPPNKHKNPIRFTSQIGSDSYNRSLRRAFSRAKLLAFFNPDLTQFITLTYHHNETNTLTVQKDIKNLIKYQKQQKQQNQHKSSYFVAEGKENVYDTETPIETSETASASGQSTKTLEARQAEKKDMAKRRSKKENHPKFTGLKYIYVLEKQKRGALHVHMIANDWFDTEWVNYHKNIKGWSHGFSDVLTIEETDNNFKPYLYLFKYMTKAQRTGRSFIHTSRTFDKIIEEDYHYYITKLSEGKILFTEDLNLYVNEKKHRITKNYYRPPQSDDQKENEKL